MRRLGRRIDFVIQVISGAVHHLLLFAVDLTSKHTSLKCEFDSSVIKKMTFALPEAIVCSALIASNTFVGISQIDSTLIEYQLPREAPKLVCTRSSRCAYDIYISI